MIEKQPKQTILSSVGDSPKSIENDSGVKDQNLFLDKTTLSVDGKTTVENTLSTRNLRVTDQVTSPCDVTIGGNLTTTSTKFNATVLSNGFNITSPTEQNKTPIFNDISNPLSQRDALTFDYYHKTSIQAANQYIRYKNVYTITVNNKNIPIKLSGGGEAQDNSYNATPNNSRYFSISTDKILLKAAGIYQVTLQCSRYYGGHSGTDEANFLLYLNSGGVKTLLNIADTRGVSGSDSTCVVLFAIFPIPESTSNNHPYIQAETGMSIDIKSFSTNVIWFPFKFNFSEVD
ncbi:hypothetical protein [Candidatus Chlamydia sanziniae]|uniref:Uncharacterized protein n=1 Tax=Candidatus Chlamydia sanziniae TaxID=1806891 RepID=A0A1A9HVY9_9CHLA|nr:hypothetical protein [Candidatus Chlamydia sanziniae]ANH79005.1 hypothetical protein Cs308_0835 [Candidatus Chlamydia sanziniae]